MSDNKYTSREIFIINAGADPEEFAKYGSAIDPYADFESVQQGGETPAFPESWEMVIEEESLYRRCRKGHSNIF